jgi:hypothetical protein
MSLLGYEIMGYHQATPTIVKGQITSQGAQTSFTINGTIQPSSSAQLAMLTEVRRLKGGIYTLFTFDTLLTVDNSVYPDLIVFNGSNYEVVSKITWKNNLINHNVYLIQEIRSR